jgi:hypothetical protein
MESILMSAAIWLAQGAGSAVFAVAQQYLINRFGLISSKNETLTIKPLLDDYLQLLTKRLDEDRVAKLHGAFSKLEDAPKSIAKQGLLVEALDSFHEVARIPQQGMTGDHPNAELRCMAFLGMAASYSLLQDQPELIAEKMVEAIRADADTAKRWLGEDLVSRVISFFPSPGIICPKCGSQNPPGSRFCNQDGYSLTSGQNPTLQHASLQLASFAPPSEVNPYGSWGTLKVDGRSKMPFESYSRTYYSYVGNSVTIKQIRSVGFRVTEAKGIKLAGDFAFQVEITFLSSAPNFTDFRGGIFFRLTRKTFVSQFYYFCRSWK